MPERRKPPFRQKVAVEVTGGAFGQHSWVGLPLTGTPKAEPSVQADANNMLQCSVSCRHATNRDSNGYISESWGQTFDMNLAPDLGRPFLSRLTCHVAWATSGMEVNMKAFK